MKRIIRFVSIVLLCCSLCSPVVEARGPEHSQQSNNSRRNNNSSRGKKSPAQHTAPAGHPGNGGNNRPAQRPQERPSHNNAGQRPGQRPPQSNGNGRPQQRPPQHNGALDRPGGNVNMRPNRPNRPDRPNGNHNMGHAPKPNPGHSYAPGHHAPKPPHYGNRPHHNYYRPAPPPRPYLPPARPYYRPVPPPAWHAPAHWNPFRTILGVALGSTISASINMLINAGYTINSYVNDAIYLNNVPMLNVNWPDATMYYNNGSLAGSEFVYYTPVPDRYRFDSIYTSLVRNYGPPVSQSMTGASLSASWWGAGNQFITLTYSGQYSVNGGLNYYTTLTFGH